MSKKVYADDLKNEQKLEGDKAAKSTKNKNKADWFFCSYRLIKPLLFALFDFCLLLGFRYELIVGFFFIVDIDGAADERASEETD